MYLSLFENKKEREARTLLERILKTAGIASEANNVLMQYGPIGTLCEKFILFISPWLVVEKENLAAKILKNSFAQIEPLYRISSPEIVHSVFMNELIKAVNLLVDIKVSVEAKDSGNRILWEYDTPLVDFYRAHNGIALRTEKRVQPIKKTPVAIFFIAHVSSVNELTFSQVDFKTLFTDEND